MPNSEADIPEPIPQPARTRARALAIPIWGVVGVCCLLPVIWMVVQVAGHPQAWGELRLDSYRIGLVRRTLVYNLSAAVLATLLALPAAIVLGRGRGWIAKLLWIVLPVSLLIPSI